MACHGAVLIFEPVPLYLVAIGVCSHLVYLNMLRSFPHVRTTSAAFIASAIACVISQVAWFLFLRQTYFPFEEVCAYFVILVWLVPFIFFISISSNDTALPHGATISASTCCTAPTTHLYFVPVIIAHLHYEVHSNPHILYLCVIVLEKTLETSAAGEVVEGDRRHNFVHNIGQTLLGLIKRDNHSLDSRVKYQ